MSKTISTQHLTNIKELDKELDWDAFEISTPSGKKITKDDFVLTAIGTPNKADEKWDMKIKDEKYNTQEDLIYALVIDGKLLKIGKSITTMKKRVQSYHCGKDKYRKKQNATNSATNWFILQSVLAIGLPVEIWCLYIPETIGNFMGWEYHNRISKEIEGKIITEFNNKYNTKPIGNKQF